MTNNFKKTALLKQTCTVNVCCMHCTALRTWVTTNVLHALHALNTYSIRRTSACSYHVHCTVCAHTTYIAYHALALYIVNMNVAYQISALWAVQMAAVKFLSFSAVEVFKEEHYFPNLVTSLLYFMNYEYIQ